MVSFAFSFSAAFVLYKEVSASAAGTPAVEEAAPVLTGPAEIASPISGKVVPLAMVSDEIFSTGVLGNDFAVEPSESKVYAPFDGECENLADTLYALGLLSKNGVSLPIYVGLETVSLDSNSFKAHAKTGGPIRKGQLLLELDMDAIKAAGVSGSNESGVISV